MKIETIDAMDRGLAYAEACFETFRVVDGDIFAWPAHAARLRRGLEQFGLSVADSQLAQMHAAALQAAAVSARDVLLRLTVSGGHAPWGLFSVSDEIEAYIQVMPYVEERAPLSLNVLAWPSPPQQRIAKFTADYAATLRLLRGERHALLVHRQQLVSAATANVLILRDDVWWTPSLAAGVLPGVVRRHLIDAGAVREAPCPLCWLDDCEAMALTASSFFVRDIDHIRQGRQLRALSRRSGELKQQMLAAAGVPGAVNDA